MQSARNKLHILPHNVEIADKLLTQLWQIQKRRTADDVSPFTTTKITYYLQSLFSWLGLNVSQRIIFEKLTKFLHASCPFCHATNRVKVVQL